MIDALKKLIVTLCKIEVKGKDNLDMLLGCIQTLEKLLQICTETHQEELNKAAGDKIDGD